MAFTESLFLVLMMLCSVGQPASRLALFEVSSGSSPLPDLAPRTGTTRDGMFCPGPLSRNPADYPVGTIIAEYHNFVDYCAAAPHGPAGYCPHSQPKPWFLPRAVPDYYLWWEHVRSWAGQQCIRQCQCGYLHSMRNRQDVSDAMIRFLLEMLGDSRGTHAGPGGQAFGMMGAEPTGGGRGTGTGGDDSSRGSGVFHPPRRRGSLTCPGTLPSNPADFPPQVNPSGLQGNLTAYCTKVGSCFGPQPIFVPPRPELDYLRFMTANATLACDECRCLLESDGSSTSEPVESTNLPLLKPFIAELKQAENEMVEGQGDQGRAVLAATLGKVCHRPEDCPASHCTIWAETVNPVTHLRHTRGRCGLPRPRKRDGTIDVSVQCLCQHGLGLRWSAECCEQEPAL